MALSNDQIVRAIMLLARVRNEGVDEVDENDEPLEDTIISDDLYMEIYDFIDEIRAEVLDETDTQDD